MVCFLAVGAWLYFGGIEGYTLVKPFDTNAVANPLAKEVLTTGNHGWMNNYSTYPITILAPVSAILGGILIIFGAGKNKAGMSFTGSTLAVTGSILTAGLHCSPS